MANKIVDHRIRGLLVSPYAVHLYLGFLGFHVVAMRRPGVIDEESCDEQSDDDIERNSQVKKAFLGLRCETVAPRTPGSDNGYLLPATIT
jgi:hypothetical protein